MELEFTKAEVQQLLSYLNGRDQGVDAGWYYAPKKAFEARHIRLKQKLEIALVKPEMGPLTNCDMHDDESY